MTKTIVFNNKMCNYLDMFWLSYNAFSRLHKKRYLSVDPFVCPSDHPAYHPADSCTPLENLKCHQCVCTLQTKEHHKHEPVLHEG